MVRPTVMVGVTETDVLVPVGADRARPQTTVSKPGSLLSPWSDQGLVHYPGDPAADQSDPSDNDFLFPEGGPTYPLIDDKSHCSQ